MPTRQDPHENQMSATARDKLLKRIELLMNLRDHANTTQGELENAALRIQELLTKLGMTEAEAAAANSSQGSTKIVVEQVAWTDDKRTTWEVALATCIANACLCEVIVTQTHAHFIGTEIDSAAAGYMWSNLAYRLDAMAAAATLAHAQAFKAATGRSAYKSPELGQAGLKKYARNWLAGAVAGINNRLLSQRQAATADVKAMITTKQAITRDQLKVMYPDLRFKVFQEVHSDEHARREGFIAGHGMELQQGLTERKPLQICEA